MSRRYACARCGRKLSSDKLQFSRHTRHHYCLDLKACERRIKKLEKEGRIFDRGFLRAVAA